MEFHLAKERGNFPILFADATVMALAVGISQEILPRWVPGKGLEFVLVEPWKIQRDPDAAARDPQSGMYWVHQEWLDYSVLKSQEAAGKYQDVGRAKDVGTGAENDPFMSAEAVKARQRQLLHRSKYRTSVLTSEFWGQVLDKSGEILLPSATFTIAGGRMIQEPQPVAYQTLRWPGIDFTPLPDLLFHGGRGLLEGVLSVWESWNQVMCLHQDYMQWIINPPREIMQEGLVNIDDVDIYPGKDILVKDTTTGHAVVRPVTSRSKTNDVLANSQHYDQLFQRGTMVTDGIQGLPGYRKEITFRESAMNLDQALGVFGLMGENMEDGAGWAIRAAADVIGTHIGYNDLLSVFDGDELAEMDIEPNPEAPNGVTGIPPFTGSFHVSGIQALLRDAETLKNLREMIIPLADSPRFAPYIKPLSILRSIEKRTNLEDEGVIATDEESRVIDIQEQLAAAKQKDAMERLQEMQEALGVAELMEKLDGLDRSDTEQMAQAILALTGEREDSRVQGFEGSRS
ncbi:MAG: hypothetical protein HGJ94_14020 [Desulfosarcina sp.]|nr:hypothetical protein [Desulfosarcina sp.]